MRALRQSRQVRKWKYQGLILGPIVFVIVYLLVPDGPAVKSVFAGGSGLAMLALHPLIYANSVRRRVEALVRESNGPGDAWPAEIEFTDTSLEYRCRGTSLALEWELLSAVIDYRDDIELRFSGRAVSVLRNEIFDGPAQRQEWLAFVRGRLS